MPEFFLLLKSFSNFSDRSWRPTSEVHTRATSGLQGRPPSACKRRRAPHGALRAEVYLVQLQGETRSASASFARPAKQSAYSQALPAQAIEEDDRS